MSLFKIFSMVLFLCFVKQSFANDKSQRLGKEEFKRDELSSSKENYQNPNFMTKSQFREFMFNRVNELHYLSHTIHDELSELKAAEKKPEVTHSLSTFEVWGRDSCPVSSEMVYRGFMGGKTYHNSGSGTNFLCLTDTPEFASDESGLTSVGYGYIQGSEYQFKNSHKDYDVPCAVCQVQKATTLMIPGTQTCPSGWTSQYYGYIISGVSSFQGTEYVCLHHDYQDVPNSEANNDGNVVAFVRAYCGSLPCSLYATDKTLTCVVCAK